MAHLGTAWFFLCPEIRWEPLDTQVKFTGSRAGALGHREVWGSPALTDIPPRGHRDAGGSARNVAARLSPLEKFSLFSVPPVLRTQPLNTAHPWPAVVQTGASLPGPRQGVKPSWVLLVSHLNWVLMVMHQAGCRLGAAAWGSFPPQECQQL